MKYKDCFLILFFVLSPVAHAEDGNDLFAAAMKEPRLYWRKVWMLTVKQPAAGRL
jgi:hypothetical protein